MSGAFLRLLGEDDRAALTRAARRRTVRAGETVFCGGDEATSFAVILAGRVKLVSRSESGRDVLIGMRTGGDIVGEMGAIDGRARSVDVVAVDEVSMLTGAAAALRAFLDARPGRWAAVCSSLSERLREADRDRVAASTLPGAERVAVRLATLAERYGTPGTARSVEVPVGQDELADWTGLSRPTIARALATLRSAGLVRTARQRIVIVDTALLAAYHLR